MQLRFDDSNYTITGTPGEIAEFMTLRREKPEQETAPIESAPTKLEPEQTPQKPAAKKPKPRKEIDWPKAKALRDAGWSYEKIGDELHCSAQNVANHLKPMEEETQNG